MVCMRRDEDRASKTGRLSMAVDVLAGRRPSLVFKLSYLALAILSWNFLTANTSLLTVVSVALTAFGFVLLTARVLRFSRFRRTCGLVLLVLFCISYVVSSAAVARYGVFVQRAGLRMAVVAVLRAVRLRCLRLLLAMCAETWRCFPACSWRLRSSWRLWGWSWRLWVIPMSAHRVSGIVGGGHVRRATVRTLFGCESGRCLRARLGAFERGRVVQGRSAPCVRGLSGGQHRRGVRLCRSFGFSYGCGCRCGVLVPPVPAAFRSAQTQGCP